MSIPAKCAPSGENAEVPVRAILGNNKPRLLKLISRPAEGSGAAPVVFIPTYWLKPAKDKKVNTKAINFLFITNRIYLFFIKKHPAIWHIYQI